MRSLSLDQLRTFETVIGLASFTAAARRLNLSQSTVSVQIRELERRFGVTLIERMGKKAYATPSGQALVEAAQRIFHECELAEGAMRHFNDGWIGRVRVGTTNTALMYDCRRSCANCRSTIRALICTLPTCRRAKALSMWFRTRSIWHW